LTSLSGIARPENISTMGARSKPIPNTTQYSQVRDIIATTDDLSILGGIRSVDIAVFSFIFGTARLGERRDADGEDCEEGEDIEGSHFMRDGLDYWID
jgi:hypothetical protein